MPERRTDHNQDYRNDRDRDYRQDRSGYAYRAGEPGPGPNIYSLRRDINAKQIAGVCAGLARHFGWNVDWLRFGWFFSAILMFPVPIFMYIGCAIFMKPLQNPGTYSRPEEEQFWRTFSHKPSSSFAQLKHRFRALDARISDMETTVTSNDYDLRRAFEDLESKK